MTIVRVKVLFFGMLKDIVGRRKTTSKWPMARAWSPFSRATQPFSRLTELESSIVLACNQEFCDRSAAIHEGDEIAFLPPVSGGSSKLDGRYTHQIWTPKRAVSSLSRAKPSTHRPSARQLLRGEDGALVDFEGVVRNNTKGRATKFLDYECYEAMAVKMMAEIGREIAGYACHRTHRHGASAGTPANRRGQRGYRASPPRIASLRSKPRSKASTV